MLYSSPFKATRFVWLGFIWVVSSGRNTIIAQHVETYKIEALDNDLIVIVMFRTATSATRCIDKCWVIDFKISGLLEKAHWWQERDGEYRSRGVDIVTDELWNLTDNQPPHLPRYSRAIGRAYAYDHCSNCLCDRTLWAITFWGYERQIMKLRHCKTWLYLVNTSLRFCIPTLECILPMLW